MKSRYIFLLCALSLASLWAACTLGTSSAKEDSREISIFRYEKLLGEYVRSNSFSALSKLTKSHREPTKILIEDVLAIGRVEEDSIMERLRHFYADTTLQRLQHDVDVAFADIRWIEKELTKGFRRLKREVPATQIPHVYTQVSAFNESIVVVDSLLGISLDKYMGEDYPLYRRFYHDYQRRTMKPERIVTDCLLFFLLSRYDIDYYEQLSMMDLILYYGKVYYVVQQILGQKTVFETIGYSSDEIAWCLKHEKALWNELFETGNWQARDPMTIRKYLRPAPSVQLLGEDAPAFLGVWLGSRVVASYMRNHPTATIQTLLDNTDYKGLLYEASLYLKPQTN